jgi:rare lipoprotein A (peptidoglycan hydrolase)
MLPLLALLVSLSFTAEARRPPPPLPPPRRRVRRPPPPAPLPIAPTEQTSARQYLATEIPELTASGDAYKATKRRVAHDSLPLGTKLRLYCPATGESVKVIVNDRAASPEGPGHSVLLTWKSAKRLDLMDTDEATAVVVTVLGCKSRYGECP